MSRPHSGPQGGVDEERPGQGPTSKTASRVAGGQVPPPTRPSTRGLASRAIHGSRADLTCGTVAFSIAVRAVELIFARWQRLVAYCEPGLCPSAAPRGGDASALLAQSSPRCCAGRADGAGRRSGRVVSCATVLLGEARVEHRWVVAAQHDWHAGLEEARHRVAEVWDDAGRDVARGAVVERSTTGWMPANKPDSQPDESARGGRHRTRQDGIRDLAKVPVVGAIVVACGPSAPSAG